MNKTRYLIFHNADKLAEFESKPTVKKYLLEKYFYEWSTSDLSHVKVLIKYSIRHETVNAYDFLIENE